MSTITNIFDPQIVEQNVTFDLAANSLAALLKTSAEDLSAQAGSKHSKILFLDLADEKVAHQLRTMREFSFVPGGRNLLHILMPEMSSIEFIGLLSFAEVPDILVFQKSNPEWQNLGMVMLHMNVSFSESPKTDSLNKVTHKLNITLQNLPDVPVEPVPEPEQMPESETPTEE